MTISRQGGHIEPEDLALYAMQLLGDDEAAAASEHLRECAACREEVAAMQGDLTAVAMSSEMQAPPAAVKQRLLQQVGRERKVAAMPAAVPSPIPTPIPIPTPPAANPEREQRESGGEQELSPVQRGAATALHWRAGRKIRDIRDGSDLDEAEVRWAARHGAHAGMVMPWLAWAVAACALVAAGEFYHQQEEMQASLLGESGKVASLSEQAERGQALLAALTDHAATQVTLTEASQTSQTIEPPRPVGRASYAPDKGALLFLASNLEPLQPYKTYELWLIPANGHDPIPAGIFQPDASGNASVILPQLPKGVIAKGFGVTVEDAGGSSQPTLPILLVGSAM